MTPGEWCAIRDGYFERVDDEWRGRAWTSSYTLIAAGCKPHEVTPAKLLGEPEPKRITAEERKRRDFEKMMDRMRRRRERKEQK